MIQNFALPSGVGDKSKDESIEGDVSMISDNDMRHHN
jgi:hypothetical protein